MTTPLFSAMEAYVNKSRARFHVPGHKGVLPYMSGLAGLDLTEIDGCDSLYTANAGIAETERRYAKLYQSKGSFLSAGGSTLCIQTMLALALNPGDTLISARGCHTSAVNAMALLDLNPCWVFPKTDEATGLALSVTAEQIKEALAQNPDAKAVYITSPDYYGRIADIAVISAVCRESGVPLLVDNAHGAHLRFLAPSLHPVGLGADICCDSLHKTLPVLTGGAMLHVGNPKYSKDVKRYMSIFGSTSPSYLVMMSVDRALEALLGDFAEKLAETAEKVKRLEIIAENAGFLIPHGLRDPLKLTLGYGRMGYGSGEFISLMHESEIEPEMNSDGFCVLMASPCNSGADFSRLEAFISSLPKKTPVTEHTHETVIPKKVMSPRAAVFSRQKELPLCDAAGKITGSMVAPCPPGIPLVIPGELICENLICCLESYGISRVNVVE